MKKASNLLLLAFMVATSFELSAQSGTCDDLTSAIEQNYCKTVRDTSMVPPIANGISGQLCGYYEDVVRCTYSVPGPGESRTFSLQRNDNAWNDQELKGHCHSIAPALQWGYRVDTVSFSGIVQGRDCRKRDWKKKCVAWTMNVSGTCNYTTLGDETFPNPAHCPVKLNPDSPKSCPSGWQIDHQKVSARLNEVDVMLLQYTKEVELYKDLNTTIDLLIDAKENLKSFQRTPEQVKKLNELLEYLVSKSGSDETITNMISTISDMIQVVSTIESNGTATSDNSELEKLKTNKRLFAKELKGKEAIIQYLNTRKGEIIQKQVEISSKL